MKIFYFIEIINAFILSFNLRNNNRFPLGNAEPLLTIGKMQCADNFFSSEAKIFTLRIKEPAFGYSSLSDYFEKFKRILEKEKLYLDPNLSLNKIARRLNINVSYLSNAINCMAQKNFHTLVNEYRVNEFKEKVLQTEFSNYTLLAIALECGFNSKSSFNRIFKRIEECTPVQYIAKAL